MSHEKKKEAWSFVLDAVNAVNQGEKKTLEQVMPIVYKNRNYVCMELKVFSFNNCLEKLSLLFSANILFKISLSIFDIP